MPIYEYHCPDCGKDQENLVNTAGAEPLCETCGGRSLRRKLSVFAVSSARPESVGCACSGDGPCADPGSGGGCAHPGGCGCG